MDFSLTDEQRALVTRARALADGPFRERAAAYDREERWPAENVADLVSAGFMGMALPAEDGGQGRSVFETALVVEEIGRTCATTARIVVDANIGPVGVLLHLGTPEQRARYLPLVLAGDKPAICITEREAGSDAGAMQTAARREGDGYRLEGRKWFITGAGVSRIYMVTARVEEEGEIGCFIVEGETPGLTTRRIPTMGVRGMPEGEVILEGCHIPAANRIPTPRGFKDILTVYNAQRVGAAAVALGIAQGALELAVARARERRQFGQPIGNFQGLQWKLADMRLAVESARWLVYRAAWGAGHALPDPAEAALAKIASAEAAQRVTNEALQIFGSYGYSREEPLERMVRDARMFTIAGGTAEVLRNLVGKRLLRDGMEQPAGE
ncbi:MAG TPA: acyl-CoA dehydrogenase family protein [Ktedonobacterales bacterium]|nr:acyl-CoA dehydrogenase family protein [Ktedonobacterales bacterium]